MNKAVINIILCNNILTLRSWRHHNVSKLYKANIYNWFTSKKNVSHACTREVIIRIFSNLKLEKSDSNINGWSSFANRYENVQSHSQYIYVVKRHLIFFLRGDSIWVKFRHSTRKTHKNFEIHCFLKMYQLNFSKKIVEIYQIARCIIFSYVHIDGSNTKKNKGETP